MNKYDTSVIEKRYNIYEIIKYNEKIYPLLNCTRVYNLNYLNIDILDISIFKNKLDNHKFKIKAIKKHNIEKRKQEQVDLNGKKYKVTYIKTPI